MRKVYIDTNIIIDLLANREPFVDESKKIFSMADRSEIEIIVSTLSLVNAHYILYDVMKIKNAKFIIGQLKVLLTSVSLNDKIVELALNDNQFKDFEDGIQYYSAIESQCELLVTRNIKDFKNGGILVMTPKEFLVNWKAGR